MSYSGLWRLMRFDKPIGIFLLWYPTAWALWIAYQGMPPLKILVLFLVGTIIMRAAGCVINDFFDRDFDKHVSRTRSRPLTQGEVKVAEALLLFIFLLCMALGVLWNLPKACWPYAAIGVFVIGIYPLCKRYIHAPQLVLGVAFSIGIWMAFATRGIFWSNALIILTFLNLLWVVAYDTMYAMADKPDDLRLNLHSTAIYFGAYDNLIVGALQTLMHLIWFIWSFSLQLGPYFYFFWAAGASVLGWQQWLIKNKTADNCMRAFFANHYYGALMWMGLIFSI
jgi:4-hydroxybenzoate polyprenyltransferase